MQYLKLGLVSIILVIGLAVSGASLSPIEQRPSSMPVYGERNPSCHVWTNWKTLCSRSTDGTAPYCINDPTSKVRSAQPFCVESDERGSRPWQNIASERREAERFCERYETMSSVGRESRPNYQACGSFRKDRPFNGLRIAVRRHPGCNAWSDGNTGKNICSETPRAGQRSCEQLAQANYENSHALVCSEWNPSKSCVRPTDMFEVADLPADRGEPDSIDVGGLPNPQWLPVVGSFCYDN